MVVSDYVFMVSTMLILFYVHGDHEKLSGGHGIQLA